MSDLLTKFEADCAAINTTPVKVLRAADVHTSLWFKWKGTANKKPLSPTLRTYEKIRATLDAMMAEREAATPRQASSEAA